MHLAGIDIANERPMSVLSSTGPGARSGSDARPDET